MAISGLGTLLLLFLISAGEAIQPQAAPEPSLADTLKWLTGPTALRKAEDGSVLDEFARAGTNDCSVMLKRRAINSPSTTIYSFSLSDIDPDSIYTEARYPASVLFHTTNYVEAITNGGAVSGLGDKISELGFATNFPFTTQFVAYLKRAAELCGGRKTASPLPDAVFEFEIETKAIAPKPSTEPLTNSDISQKTQWVIARPNYRLCNEISRDLTLEGGSSFQRIETSSNHLSYSVGAYLDIFEKTSKAIAHVKILEVPSESAAAKCPHSGENAFPTIVERGPSYGWSSEYRYLDATVINAVGNIIQNKGNATNRNEVRVNAPDGTDYIYCTHKFVVGSMTELSSYHLSSWTGTTMAINLITKGQPGGAGGHASLTLYVRYLPPKEREKNGDKFGCTAMPPSKYAHGGNPQQKQLPDGSSMFVP